jgi:homoprotocatechuate degradation regulator HpaR
MLKRTILSMLREARSVVKQAMQPCLSVHGLTEQQWRVLKVLSQAQMAGQEGVDAGCIAREGRILPSTLTGVLTRLERDGRVTRRRSASDGRFMLVLLTDEGQQLVGVVTEVLREEYARIEQQLGAEDLQQLFALLDKVIALDPKKQADSAAS